MQLRLSTLLIVVVVCISACGRQDRNEIPNTESTLPTKAATSSIGAVLGRPTVSGQVVEVDAYSWNGYTERGAHGVELDPQRCPLLNGNATLLTDNPVPQLIQVLNGAHSNFSTKYPPREAAWLIPVESQTPAYPPQREGLIIPIFPLPYHARLRGHFSDPAFAHCPHADRTFVVENVVTVYEAAANNPAPFDRRLPKDYASWPRYHDASLGISFPYPPTWQVQPVQGSDVVASVVVRPAEWPDYPVYIRVHTGETHNDQNLPASKPPLLRNVGYSILRQTVLFGNAMETQQLVGYHVEYPQDPDPGKDTRKVSALFSGSGRTNELTLEYPFGIAAQPLLTLDYTAIVAGFRLDVAPGPPPTPPVKQTVGKGPFLEREQVLAQAHQSFGSELELLDAKIISEADARTNVVGCDTFDGHPDGVWFLAMRGPLKESDTGIKGAQGTIHLLFDAVTGLKLCGSVVAMSTPVSPSEPAQPTSQPKADLPYPAPTSTRP